MPTAPFNHGTRIIQLGDEPRPLEIADVSTVGTVVTAPHLDTKIFPYNEPFHFYTHEVDKVAALGTSGTALDAVKGIKGEGVEASIVMIAVEEGKNTEASRVKLIDAADGLTLALGHLGIEPDILLSPGYVAGRIDNAKNPLAAKLDQIATKLKSIAILDTGGPNKESSLAYRADFDSRYCYLVDPFVRVMAGDNSVVKPASPVVTGLFIKKDKEKGGPYWSPSNQEAKAILGTARPISFYDGEIDHEANFLNQNGIATFIPSQVIQSATGQFSKNGRILWGNRTTSTDPLWQFINVVRTRATIEKTVVRSFRWANDENLSPGLIMAIIRSLNEFIDELKSVGAILGGQVIWERNANTNSMMRLGKLRIDFDAEESPPLEDLTFGSRRNEAYFDILADTINRHVVLSFERVSNVA